MTYFTKYAHFLSLSAIRKPKIITFSKTGSKLFYVDFIVFTTMKQYSGYRHTVNNTTVMGRVQTHNDRGRRPVIEY